MLEKASRDEGLHKGVFPLRLIWLLLLVPCVALIWVPFYNRSLPELFGFPFFYWYQLLWVPGASLLTYIVYRRIRDDR